MSVRSPAQVTSLCLVRHGETAWNAEGRVQGQTDVPLNALGTAQADAVGAALAFERFSAIYSSDRRGCGNAATAANAWASPSVRCGAARAALRDVRKRPTRGRERFPRNTRCRNKERLDFPAKAGLSRARADAWFARGRTWGLDLVVTRRGARDGVP